MTNKKINMYKIEITEIIPQYGKLNKIYEEVQINQNISYRQQRFITSFYEQIKNTQEIEAAVIKLILAVASEHYSVLLNSLKQEIETNISIYLANQSLFNNINIEKVCLQYANRYQLNIEQQTALTKEYYSELMEVNGSLEAISFSVHTQEEKDLLYKKYDRCNADYKREQKKLHELFDMQNKDKQEAAKSVEKRFEDIYKIDCSILSFLEKYTTCYINKEKEDSSFSSSKTDMNQSVYFPMKVVSAIYEICNNEQFESISDMDFYANLNLQSHKIKLKVRPREKTRVCYLISLLSEYLIKQDRENWKTAILELLEIDIEYYKSKYKEPTYKFPSGSNQKFADKIQAIFK